MKIGKIVEIEEREPMVVLPKVNEQDEVLGSGAPTVAGALGLVKHPDPKGQGL